MADDAKKGLDENLSNLQHAIRELGSLQERDREEKRQEALAGPVAPAAAFRVRDPRTDKRQVRYGVTGISMLKISFRPMTLGDLKCVPEELQDGETIKWPQAAKARIVAHCLVEPDLEWPNWLEDMPDEALIEWTNDNLSWIALDDILVEIRDRSMPQFYVPDFRPAGEEAEKGGSLRQSEPGSESSRNGSTDSADTVTSDGEVSID
jgi:hypothetical protein